MCFPNDPDELRRIEFMGKTMDAAFDALFKPKPPNPDVCWGCGIDIRQYGRCSICEEAIMGGDRSKNHE